MAGKKINIPSTHLSAEENEYLFSLLGENCITMATGIVQLLKGQVDALPQWKKLGFGILCYVRDANFKSYYLRLYSLEEDTILFDEEMYDGFQFKSPKQFFLMYNSAIMQSVLGLNFFDSKEAMKFTEVHAERILKQATKKQPIAIQPNNIPTITVRPTVNLKKKKKDNKKNKKPKISKGDIGTPANFQHVGGVKNIEQVEKVYQYVKTLDIFKGRDVTQEQIEGFAKDVGGIDILYKEMERMQAQVAEAPHSKENKKMNKPNIPSAPPPTPSHHVHPAPSVPPPPPPTTMPPAPPKQQAPPPPIPPSISAPPPPPPPPPPGAAANLNVNSAERTQTSGITPELLSRATLSTPAPQPENSRADMLEQIRNPGIKLKKVADRPAVQTPSPSSESFGLFGELANSLSTIRNAVDVVSDDNDSEWDSD